MLLLKNLILIILILLSGNKKYLKIYFILLILQIEGIAYESGMLLTVNIFILAYLFFNTIYSIYGLKLFENKLKIENPIRFEYNKILL